MYGYFSHILVKVTVILLILLYIDNKITYEYVDNTVSQII